MDLGQNVRDEVVRIVLSDADGDVTHIRRFQSTHLGDGTIDLIENDPGALNDADAENGRLNPF